MPKNERQKNGEARAKSEKRAGRKKKRRYPVSGRGAFLLDKLRNGRSNMTELWQIS